MRAIQNRSSLLEEPTACPGCPHPRPRPALAPIAENSPGRWNQLNQTAPGLQVVGHAGRPVVADELPPARLKPKSLGSNPIETFRPGVVGTFSISPFSGG